MHIPYDIKFNHKADFRIEYSFYTHEEGGRKSTPHQGYRSDFYYENSEHTAKQIFMIWPEFEDENGSLILGTSKSVSQAGTARMWILVPQMRSYHKVYIHDGLKGYLMEGGRPVAVCYVTEILGLQTNPTEPVVINGKQY